jgi:starch synthase
MRYGAIPIVTATGGLVDTVIDVDRDARGTGFVADRTTPEDLLAAMLRAARRVRDRRRREALQTRVMAIDWSWTGPARAYWALYGELAG